MSSEGVGRDRAWLRSFLDLGARAEAENIPAGDIERQEETILRALEILDTRPGVVLADEVGMGKTYEALGIAAAFRQRKRKSRVVVVTPGPELNHKWDSEFERFSDMYDFGGTVTAARRLRAFASAVQTHPIVIAPVSMFQAGRGAPIQQYLISLYGHWKQLHGKTTNAILDRIGDYRRVNVERELFLGEFELARLERHLGRAFKRRRKSEVMGLDDLYESGGLRVFSDEPRLVKRALQRARFNLVRALMPRIDLLIVDEAHKLKNAGSLRSRGMRAMFEKRFDKALFLTATPFQLDIGELREVFSLFSLARTAPDNLETEVAELLSAVRDYQRTYDDFQATWSSLDVGAASEFAEEYQRGRLAGPLESPSLEIIAAKVRALKALKREVIEPAFRSWMIRSLSEGKRQYRNHDRRPIDPSGNAIIPFLIYERFIAELFRRRRQTHKASVEINMVSSFAAARTGTLLESDASPIPEEATAYRELLREILGELDDETSEHPKLVFAVDDALNAADRGEKTLVFCSRVATLEQLRRELKRAWRGRLADRWQRLYPDDGAADMFDSSGRGRYARLRERFQRGQSPLYLALRERYLRTLVPIARSWAGYDWATNEEWALARTYAIAESANAKLATIRVNRAAAEGLDYQVAKRCVEQAAVELWRNSTVSDLDDLQEQAVERMTDERYLTLGLDLEADAFERDPTGTHAPSWKISERTVRAVIGEPGSLWARLSRELQDLDLDLRVRVVEQLASYLTFQEVPFVVDLLEDTKRRGIGISQIDGHEFVSVVDEFWISDTGQKWLAHLREFLQYFGSRTPSQQLEILDGPIRTGDFARHTKEGESREKLREAFNTPLFPMVLIANEVMQEGLDLHKCCRRIVHHDLLWNPAQLEQRVGRIDRLGSKARRLRTEGRDATLDVLYPVINGTIDERLYSVVKRREKWLEFLLGAQPNFAEYSLDHEEPPPLPPGLAESLAIDLTPPGARRRRRKQPPKKKPTALARKKPAKKKSPRRGGRRQASRARHAEPIPARHGLTGNIPRTDRSAPGDQPVKTLLVSEELAALPDYRSYTAKLIAAEFRSFHKELPTGQEWFGWFGERDYDAPRGLMFVIGLSLNIPSSLMDSLERILRSHLLRVGRGTTTPSHGHGLDALVYLGDDGLEYLRMV